MTLFSITNADIRMRIWRYSLTNHHFTITPRKDIILTLKIEVFTIL